MLLLYIITHVGVSVAAAATVETSRSGASCAPSLLQVSAIRSQVLVKQAPQEPQQAGIPLKEAFALVGQPVLEGSSDPVVTSGWGRQFLLKVGTVVVLVLLLGAGLVICLDRYLGHDDQDDGGGINSTDSLETRAPRFTAWGDHVENEVCDYVMVFSSSPQPTTTSLASDDIDLAHRSTKIVAQLIHHGPQRIVASFELAKKAFMEPGRHHFVSEAELRERFPEEMTFEAYRDAVCDFFWNMLTSPQFGVTIEQFANADEGRLFWKLDLEESAVAQYAAHYRYPVSLNDEAYEKCGQPVPTNWFGERVHGFFQYMPKWRSNYMDMTQTDRLKLLRLRVERFVSLDALMEQRILLQHFAVHDVDEIGNLVKAWGNLHKWYRFPRYADIDKVKDYFGEQVAFMFLWQRFYLSALLVPAVVGGCVFFRRFCLPERMHSTVQMVFAVIMSLWATIFNARYARFEARTCQRWGMSEFTSDASNLQPGYHHELQGSWRVTLVYSLGDLSAFLMCLLSVFSIFGIQHLRAYHHDEWGIESRWYVEKGTALLTAVQIILMDWAWQFMSYAMVNNENHRLRSDWWESWIKRVLTVRVFTNLYPFVYVGFLKHYSAESCPDTPSGCLDELQTNLFIFFAISVVSNLSRDIGLIAYARFQHAMGLRVSGSDDHLSLQVQATLYDYNAWVFIDDWTRQVTTFLLMTCFNVILPVIGVFVLLTAMVEARLLAHRICCNLQRPFPQGSQGIGSWQNALEVMTFLGVLMTVSFSIFVMRPLRDRPMWEKFVIFVLSEHVMLLLNLFVRTQFPKKPHDVFQVAETNEKMLMQNFIDPTLHSINIDKSQELGGSLVRSRMKHLVGSPVSHVQAQGARLDVSTGAVPRPHLRAHFEEDTASAGMTWLRAQASSQLGHIEEDSAQSSSSHLAP